MSSETMHLDSSAKSYISKFLLTALFVCSVGMISATAVTLKDEISDRCVILKRNNQEIELKKVSHDAVVIGGFSIAASVFAGLSLVCLFKCNPTDSRKSLYGALLVVACLSFLIVGGVELSRVDDPEKRCSDLGDTGAPMVEIASTLVSGLTIVGLLTPFVEKLMSK